MKIHHIYAAILGSNNGMNDDFATVLCPCCGFDFVHCGTPHARGAQDGYAEGWGGNEDLLVIPCWSECGSRFEICLGFHKGTTSLFVKEIATCHLDAAKYDSPLEALFAEAWVHCGFSHKHDLVYQYPIDYGRYRLDFAEPTLRLGIELDGYTYHSDRRAFTNDRKRQREIEARGWRVIRFSGDELRADIHRCVTETAQFLSAQQCQQQQREQA